MYILGAGPGAARACRPQTTTKSGTFDGKSAPWPRRPRLVALPRPPAPRAAAPDSSLPAFSPTTSAAAPTIPPVPKSIADVDNGRILGFGPDLAPDHPGFGDASYARRRAAVARLALAHVPGTPPPVVEYGADELATWRAALARLSAPDMLPKHACREYLDSFRRLNFSADHVPQLADVDALLSREAGWRVRPVAGLMHPRDFLAGLAFRTFHSTQYVRHPSQPGYTPEPDLVHELVGHAPMLLVPSYARMAEAVGRASLGASEAQLWHLVKVYWFAIEFGVLWEEGEGGRQLKAFGAGILSSSAEMEWLGKGGNGGGGGGGGNDGGGADPSRGGYEVLPLAPGAPLPRMSYKDGVQRRYYSLEGFEQGAALLEAYARAGAPAPAAPAPAPDKQGGGGGESGEEGRERRSAR